MGPDDVVRGAEAAGAKQYLAPRKRGREPRTGAVMLARIVVGLAVTRDGF